MNINKKTIKKLREISIMDNELKEILVDISNGINYLENDLEFIKETNTDILFHKLDKIIDLLEEIANKQKAGC